MSRIITSTNTARRLSSVFSLPLLKCTSFPLGMCAYSRSEARVLRSWKYRRKSSSRNSGIYNYSSKLPTTQRCLTTLAKRWSFRSRKTMTYFSKCPSSLNSWPPVNNKWVIYKRSWGKKKKNPLATRARRSKLNRIIRKPYSARKRSSSNVIKSYETLTRRKMRR